MRADISKGQASCIFQFSFFCLQKSQHRSNCANRVIRICFCVFLHKNRNIGIAMLAADQINYMYVFLLYQYQKLRRQDKSFIRSVAYTCFCFFTLKNRQLFQQQFRLVAYTYFHFFYCKNCIAMSVAGQASCTYLFLLFCL